MTELTSCNRGMQEPETEKRRKTSSITGGEHLFSNEVHANHSITSSIHFNDDLKSLKIWENSGLGSVAVTNTQPNTTIEVNVHCATEVNVNLGVIMATTTDVCGEENARSFDIPQSKKTYAKQLANITNTLLNDDLFISNGDATDMMS